MGRRELPLAIGSFPLRLDMPSRPLLGAARRRYRGFESRLQGGFPVSVNPPAKRRYAEVLFRYDLHGARLRMMPAGAELHGVARTHTLDSFLRILMSVQMVRYQGLLLHAATIVRDGCAHVFMGQSGVGKSTLARLAPAGTVLTDEVSLLRRTDSGWKAFGTPFWGEFRAGGKNVAAPVAAVYILRHAARHRVTQMPARRRLPELLANVLFFKTDRQDLQMLLQVAHSLCDAVPLKELEFRPATDVWEALA